MVESNLPVVVGSLAAARQAEQDALNGDDPWTRADAQAGVWLRSPRFAPDTKAQYAAVWRSWRLWCVATGIPPFDAQRSDLEAYTTALETVGNPASRKPRPLARRSVARHMAAISSYYRRAISDQKTDRNPVPPQDRPKVKRTSRQPYLEPAEVRALVAAADADSPRTAALVALLVMACLRVSEALGANVEDITPPRKGVRFVHVTRKGDKEEDVPLSPPAWQRVRPMVEGRKGGPLLATESGRRLDRKAAWKTLRRLGQRAGIESPIGPHTLRHAYITRGHELGIPLADLKDAAGHEDARTTSLYNRSGFDPARHPSFIIALDMFGR
jgi:site-specific recombinase XerD